MSCVEALIGPFTLHVVCVDGSSIDVPILQHPDLACWGRVRDLKSTIALLSAGTDQCFLELFMEPPGRARAITAHVHPYVIVAS